MSVVDEALAECRALLARGAAIEELLRALRDRGATKMESIKALVDLDVASLREAKSYVHLSRTWSDVRERDDQLHAALHSAMSTDPAPDKDH